MATFTTSDGVAIRYEVRGAGAPVAVCHGGPNNISDTEMRDLAPVEDSFALVFHDYRGSGGSAAAPASTYSFDRFADDLDELREHLGYESMPVLAHSMGGFVALNYALRHREKCQRLALVATTPCGVGREMVVPVLRALGPLRTAKAVALAVRFIVLWSWRSASTARTQAMYAPWNVTQEPRRELRAMVASAHPELPVDNDNAPHLMKAMSGLDLRDKLGSIHCPALVIYGSRDAAMVVGGRMLASGLGSAEVRVLADIGHEVFLETPAEAFGIIRDFLRPD
jgi:pimeloyl-ACP methyl ester carboxylesterase